MYRAYSVFTAILKVNTALPWSFLAVTSDAFCCVSHTHFYIDDKGHKLELRSNRNYLTNHKIQIIPLVINCLWGWTHRHRHIHKHIHKHTDVYTRVISGNQACAWFNSNYLFDHFNIFLVSSFLPYNNWNHQVAYSEKKLWLVSEFES